jgi:cardiolipin synthase
MRLTLPNLLSLLRMGLVPLFIIAVLDGEALKALILFLAAGITDLLDGAIARFWGQESLLGSYLDPIADKLLLTSAYVVLAVPSLNEALTIPVWVTVLVLARDILIVLLALVLHLTVGVRRFPPTWISKVTTVAQVVAVLLVLIAGRWPEVHFVASLVVVATAGLTVVSGLNYLFRINRIAADGREG